MLYEVITDSKGDLPGRILPGEGEEDPGTQQRDRPKIRGQGPRYDRGIAFIKRSRKKNRKLGGYTRL